MNKAIAKLPINARLNDAGRMRRVLVRCMMNRLGLGPCPRAGTRERDAYLARLINAPLSILAGLTKEELLSQYDCGNARTKKILEALAAVGIKDNSLDFHAAMSEFC